MKTLPSISLFPSAEFRRLVYRKSRAFAMCKNANRVYPSTSLRQISIRPDYPLHPPDLGTSRGESIVVNRASRFELQDAEEDWLPRSFFSMPLGAATRRHVMARETQYAQLFGRNSRIIECDFQMSISRAYLARAARSLFTRRVTTNEGGEFRFSVSGFS